MYKILIYTSYFSAIKQLEDNGIVPISICGKAPDWYTGLQYKKLAPKYSFFKEWKENHNNAYYTECYYEQVLKNLSVLGVLEDLKKLVGEEVKDIALICYERPSDFCHRHLVSAWLKVHEVPCEEWSLET